MSIRISSLTLPGSTRLEENRLPQFRAVPESPVCNDSELLEPERHNYGYQVGRRVLPYRMQDVYDRSREPVTLKTIELENDCLKAVFLAEYGMRLYSLYDKVLGRELLFRNPVFQMANLALRDAWFSGGIEWNFGQMGHAFTTCSPVYAAVCREPGGEEFLRCYEYEACKRMYWQVDFHLPEHARELTAYFRFVNPLDEAVPFYWWTNTAVPEEPRARVFSGNKEIIYKKILETRPGGERILAHGSMPFPGGMQKDASYPGSFQSSNEYFFQNEHDPAQTWEAVCYADGSCFFERSSPRLRYRKMFCWGNHKGGRHWKDFLSDPGKGAYLEIQAGVAPTQSHGLDIPANTEWDFVQIFGGADGAAEWNESEWEAGCRGMYRILDERVPQQRVEQSLEEYRACADLPVQEILQCGSGLGALEQARGGVAPEGLLFPEQTIGPQEQPWLELLRTGNLPDVPPYRWEGRFLTDLRWLPLLERAAQSGNTTAAVLIGVLLTENSRREEARGWFERAGDDPLALRCLAQLEEDPDRACDLMSRALGLLGDEVTREYAQEYLQFLTQAGRLQQAWDFYDALDASLQAYERVRLYVLSAALKLGKIDFLDEQYSHPFAVVREGEREYTGGYFTYQAWKDLPEGQDCPTEEQIRQKWEENRVPDFIDFRLSSM